MAEIKVRDDSTGEVIRIGYEGERPTADEIAEVLEARTRQRKPAQASRAPAAAPPGSISLDLSPEGIRRSIAGMQGTIPPRPQGRGPATREEVVATTMQAIAPRKTSSAGLGPTPAARPQPKRAPVSRSIDISNPSITVDPVVMESIRRDMQAKRAQRQPEPPRPDYEIDLMAMLGQRGAQIGANARDIVRALPQAGVETGMDVMELSGALTGPPTRANMETAANRAARLFLPGGDQGMAANAARAAAAGKFGEFARGVPAGIERETETNPIGQVGNILGIGATAAGVAGKAAGYAARRAAAKASERTTEAMPARSLPPLPDAEGGLTPPSAAAPRHEYADLLDEYATADDASTAAAERLRNRRAAATITAEDVDAAVSTVQPAPVAAESNVPYARVPLDDIALDPSRFQYKMSHDEGGSTGSLGGVKAWNDTLAGAIDVWRDPADGKVYVVNGHNRYDLARRMGRDDVTVRFIDEPDAASARTAGAMANIAAGHGTPFDAAKMFMDAKVTPDELADMGINVTRGTARQGVALSNLAPSLFNKAMSGELPLERAVMIGERLPSQTDQVALIQDLDRLGKRGRTITNGVLGEMIENAGIAPRKTETVSTLFGDDDVVLNTAVHRAEAADHISTELGREGKLFGATSRNAERLEKGDNRINADRSAEIAEAAARARETFNREKNTAGSQTADVLNRAATRLANGERADVVKRDAFNEIANQLTGQPGANRAAAGPRRTDAVDQRGAGTAAGAVEKLDAVADAASERIKKRNRGRLNAGVDPEDVRDLSIWLGAKLAKGAVKSADAAKVLADEFGDWVRPHMDEVLAEAVKLRDHAVTQGRWADAGQAVSTAGGATAADSSKNPPKTPRARPDMAGQNINLDRMDLSKAEKDAVRAAATDLGLDQMPVQTHREIIEGAKALGLTFKHLEGVEPGRRPKGFENTPAALYNMAIRMLNARGGEMVRGLEVRARADRSSANLKALQDATASHANALKHNATIVNEEARSFGSRRAMISPYESNNPADLFRPDNPAAMTASKGRPRGGTRAPLVRKAKSADFNKNAKIWTKDEFNESLERVKGRFRRADDMADCKE